MKHQDLLDTIKKAATSYSKRNSLSDYRTRELLAEVESVFVKGVEGRGALKIRHTNTHAAKCCLED